MFEEHTSLVNHPFHLGILMSSFVIMMGAELKCRLGALTLQVRVMSKAGEFVLRFCLQLSRQSFERKEGEGKESRADTQV